MIFEQVRTGGCLSYVIGCAETRAGVLVDPELEQVNTYLGLASEKGLRLTHVIDTHTHADHFSGAREIAQELGIPAVMHCHARAPYATLRVEDGESIIIGKLRLKVLFTPGHTDDSMCLVLPDRVLTGDTLLIGGTGRTDLPTGNPEVLYASLFDKLLKLDDKLQVFPAHDYKGRSNSTLGVERAENPRLQAKDESAFVKLMRGLDIAAPQHLTEALRTNRYGGKTVTQLIAEATRSIAFMSMEELRARIEAREPGLEVLDVREKDEYNASHIPGARHIPRGQLELRVDAELRDPTSRIVAYCRFGKISTLAAATLRSMGYTHVVALDGGFEAWSKAGFPTQS